MMYFMRAALNRLHWRTDGYLLGRETDRTFAGAAFP
jgi:hypothetical protein